MEDCYTKKDLPLGSYWINLTTSRDPNFWAAVQVISHHAEDDRIRLRIIARDSNPSGRRTKQRDIRVVAGDAWFNKSLLLPFYAPPSQKFLDRHEMELVGVGPVSGEKVRAFYSKDGRAVIGGIGGDWRQWTAFAEGWRYLLKPTSEKESEFTDDYDYGATFSMKLDRTQIQESNPFVAHFDNEPTIAEMISNGARQTIVHPECGVVS